MAQVIEFYVPRSFRRKPTRKVKANGMVIIFPAIFQLAYVAPPSEEMARTEERRRHPRVGLFAMLEDSIYKVLRNAERNKTGVGELAPETNALAVPATQ